MSTVDILEQFGYVVLPLFSVDEIDQIKSDVSSRMPGWQEASVSRGHVFAVRNLDNVWPACLEWARHPALARAIARVLGPGSGLVRAIYFDKPPDRSWSLPWHQDLIVPVARILPGDHFRNPTVKGGQLHCEAPVAVLEQMLTARIHLDSTSRGNGALEVSPGTHRHGKTRPNPDLVETIDVQVGDVLLMRPLLLHCSGRSAPTNRLSRRVLHFEYASAVPLPDGFEWPPVYRLSKV